MPTNAMGRESNKTGAAGAGKSGGSQSGGSNADKDRKARSDMDKANAEAKGRMDKKTADALSAAFGVQGQATRQLDTPTNARASGAFSGEGSDPTPNDLPPGLNPLTYEKNPTPSYEATPENIAKVIGGAISGVAAPGIGIGLGPIASDALGMGFESPTGPTTTGTRMDHAPGQDNDTVDDEQGQPTLPVTPAAPPAEVPVPDLWEYPTEDTDQNAGAPQDGLSDEERRRRGNTSIVVLGQGGLAI